MDANEKLRRAADEFEFDPRKIRLRIDAMTADNLSRSEPTQVNDDGIPVRYTGTRCSADVLPLRAFAALLKESAGKVHGQDMDRKDGRVMAAWIEMYHAEKVPAKITREMADWAINVFEKAKLRPLLAQWRDASLDFLEALVKPPAAPVTAPKLESVPAENPARAALGDSAE